jgi:hypothetical protein
MLYASLRCIDQGYIPIWKNSSQPPRHMHVLEITNYNHTDTHFVNFSYGQMPYTSRKEAFHPNPLVPKYFSSGLMGSLVPVLLGNRD